MAERFTIDRANAFIADQKGSVDEQFKPTKHFTAEIGWINDPNGFVFFRGEYHLFYQFYPYGSFWGPMHWGHAKSADLVHWEHLPVALAPDMPYDKDGCFSGSAIVKDDVLWLMYTGNILDSDGSVRQVQNMAYSKDGIHFSKIAENPVATGDCLPDELVIADFRDPKLFKKDDRYYAVVAAKHKEDVGTIVLLGSDDLTHWDFESIFLKGRPEQGIMWECPDYFFLDGKDVLILSPMRFERTKYDYRNLNSSVIMVGHVDWEEKRFVPESVREIDHGHDYYAPQTMLDDDGQRIAIAWVHTWGRNFPPHELGHGWAGSMTLPRRLSLQGEHFLQQILPASLTALPEVTLGQTVEAGYINLVVEGELTLQLGTTDDYIRFGYDQKEGVVYIDRSHLLHQAKGEETWDMSRRAVLIQAKKLLVIFDRNTVEIFVNDGEETLTSAFYIDGPHTLRKIL
ncbi:glycoside hydrolase family 32 protein [Streptococcus sp. DD13]|uniref:glycoside hydrolase family 32 protein n=1 Tax=Streptococcus sp. DD13 TaxID=1777881 RepID=UPI000799162C|nr:glycoside hydrolase family 32 protein [Streptococcus sp. DD13]KXT78083.1 Sucrose-6-phosphate hydrolase [Streptococcus sp. DD13]